MRISTLSQTVLVALLLCLAGCGGGGGGGGSGAAAFSAGPITADTTTTSSAPPQPIALTNVLPVTVDGGPAGFANVNIPYVSVTICVPGSAACQTIDHVVVDTGSTGLRVVASVLNAALALPRQTDGGGNSLAECAVFADGFAWGAVRLADVQLGGASASSIPIQIIGDPAFPQIPTTCSSRGPAEDTVQKLGGNGVLGVGAFLEDCGLACAHGPIPAAYYTCPTGGCQPVAVSLARQVQNPVAQLDSDNNGVVLDLPAVPASGTASVSGSLILGIGTQSNNALGGAIRYDLDSSGNFTTVFNNRTVTAFLDSGSNALFFASASTPVCRAAVAGAGFYCPVAPLALTALIQGAGNGANASVNFSVANADTLFSGNPGFAAFNNLAGPAFGAGATFDWGLPFFYGRRVYTAFDQRSTPPVGVGPYVAF